MSPGSQGRKLRWVPEIPLQVRTRTAASVLLVLSPKGSRPRVCQGLLQLLWLGPGQGRPPPSHRPPFLPPPPGWPPACWDNFLTCSFTSSPGGVAAASTVCLRESWGHGRSHSRRWSNRGCLGRGRPVYPGQGPAQSAASSPRHWPIPLRHTLTRLSPSVFAPSTNIYGVPTVCQALLHLLGKRRERDSRVPDKQTSELQQVPGLAEMDRSGQG